MKTISVVLFALLLLPGCQTLLRVQGQVAKQAANGINAVCDNTDEKFRRNFLNEVNLLAAPNSATFYCEGDGAQLVTK